jgi:hypothetical protein
VNSGIMGCSCAVSCQHSSIRVHII